MTGPLYEYLSQDHARLDALLRRSVESPDGIDHGSFAEFRAGLLRHIRMEEQVLFPAARRLRGGHAPPIIAQLHRDHAALAALLVPTPTPEIVRTIIDLLERHNVLEDGPGGVYEVCEQLAVGELNDLVAKLRAIPAVSVAQHFDGPEIHRHIRTLLDAASARTGIRPDEDTESEGD